MFVVSLLGVMALLPIGCVTSSEIEVPINRDVALMIATADVPTRIIGEAGIRTLWDESKWVVHFSLGHNNPVTRNEIGWPEDSNNRFVNQGVLPEGTYSLLTITIDRRTGAVLSRHASDSLVLGGPGTFNTEPPKAVFFRPWSVVASGLGGLVVGGAVLWLVGHRRKPSVAA